MNKRFGWGVTASIISFLVGTATPEALAFVKRNDELHQNAESLTDSERDYVLKVVELQSKTTSPSQAQAIASLTNAATGTYLRNKQFSASFANAVTNYAIAVSGNAAFQESTQAKNSGQAPATAGASDALGRVQAASAIASASTSGATASATQVALQSGRGRVFLQVARPEDRPVAQTVNGQLTSIPNLGLTPIEGIELVPAFKGSNQLRYFFQADRAKAQRIALALAGALPGLTCKYIGGYDVTGRVKPQLFEVWLQPGTKLVGNVGQSRSPVSC